MRPYTDTVYLSAFIAFMRQNGLPLSAKQARAMQKSVKAQEMPVKIAIIKPKLTQSLGENPDTRETFTSLFDQYFQPYLATQDTITVRVHDTSMNSQQLEGAEIGRGDWLLSKRRFYLMVQLMILLVSGLVGWQLIRCWGETRQLDAMFVCAYEKTLGNNFSMQPASEIRATDPPETLLIDSTARFPQEIEPQIALPEAPIIEEDIRDLEAGFFQKYGTLLKVLGILLILSFLVFYQLYKYNRRKFFDKREAALHPPYFWNVHHHNRRVELSKEADFFEASAQLQQVASEPGLEGKCFLVLIEKQAAQDHLAMLTDQLIMDMTQQGVKIDRYFYDHDPRRVWRQKFTGEIDLPDLHQLYPDHQLLIIGEAEILFDPVQDEWLKWVNLLDAWQRPIFMTSKCPLSWGQREIRVSERYTLIPTTLQALTALPELVQPEKRPALRYWLKQNHYPPVPDLAQDNLIPALHLYFDTQLEDLKEAYREGSGKDLFTWLCMCAIHSDLTWDLTLSMGSALGQVRKMPLTTPALVAKLSMLPWFRKGSIPKDVRSELIGLLPKTDLQLAQQVLLNMLRENPPPPASYASAEHQLKLHILEAELNPGIRRHLQVMQEIQDFALNHEVEDPMITHYLHHHPRVLPQVTLPEPVSETVFEQGEPSLGIRPWLRVAMGILFASGMLYSLWNTEALMHLYNFEGKTYYLANDTAHMRFHVHKGNAYLKDERYASAQTEYERALEIRQALNEPEYLTPDYNLSTLKLLAGNEIEASQDFARLSSEAENILDQPEKKLADHVPKESLIDIKSNSDYNKGLIAIRSQDEARAVESFGEASKNPSARISLDAEYAAALVLLKKAENLEGLNQKNKLSLALSRIDAILEQNPQFFQEANFFQTHQDPQPTLERLKQAIDDQGLNEAIDVIQKRIRGEKVEPTNIKEQPISPPSSQELQTFIQTDFEYLSDPLDGPVLYRYEGQYGFVSPDGVLQPTRYEDALPFSEGIGAVKSSQGWSFVTYKDEKIVRAMDRSFDKVKGFRYGVASVKEQGKWGLIDQSGAYVVSPTYNQAIEFESPELLPDRMEPLAVVQEGGRYYFINTRGKEAFKGERFQLAKNFEGAFAVVKRWGKKYLIDREGNCVPRTLPNGVCPKEEWEVVAKNPLEGHKGQVVAVDISEDGRYLVTASDDRTVRVLSANGLQALSTLYHPDRVRSTVISHDGRYIITGTTDGRLNIWSPSGTKLQELERQSGAVIGLAFSQDDKWLAVGTSRARVLLYATGDWSMVRRFNTLNQENAALAFNGQGDVFSAGDRGVVQRWSKDKETALESFDTGSTIYAIDVDPQSERLIAGTRSGNVHTWDITGDFAQEVSVERRHQDWVRSVTFDPSGQYILSVGQNGQVRVQNAKRQDVVTIQTEESIRDACFGAEGDQILVATRSGEGKVQAILYRLDRE
ncbi:MAG: WG repeat-containing protein [Bacteroidota bacterium]